MKYLVIAFSIIMSLVNGNTDQNDFDFDKAWIEVENDIKNRLPKSALEKSERILKEAEILQNDPQQAKSLIYIARLTIQTEEEGVELVMERLENKVKTLQGPLKYIMATYVAELYENYFSAHRWMIADRTAVADETAANFKTWDAQRFLQTIEYWYLFSIQDKSIIDVPVEDYQLVMQTYNDAGRSFKPTVYEVLADRALAFFNDYNNYRVSNAESFVVDQAWYFDDVTSFVNTPIQDQDTSASSYKILKLYQEILSKELKANNLYALADYDLNRLGYIYAESTLEHKSDLYLQALERLSASCRNIDYYTEVVAVQAQHILNVAIGKDPKVTALSLCEQAIKAYPNSSGAAKCTNIVRRIKEPELQIFAESVYPSHKAMLFAFEHNNVDAVDISIYKLTKDHRAAMHSFNENALFEYILVQPLVQSSTQKLALSPSFDLQKTEWSHAGLDLGIYALVVASKGDHPIYRYVLFDVSNLSYTTYLKGINRTILVSNRVTGAPISDVAVELYQESYNYSTNKVKITTFGNYKTDKLGMVQFEDKTNTSFKVRLKYGDDVWEYDKSFYTYRIEDWKPYNYAEFYTDRAIYRPGQTVYFKAILLQQSAQSIPSILTNKALKIRFLDANYKEISQISKKSNAFGSIEGSFVIPEGRLTGSYSIEVDYGEGITGRKWFRVEEYKRPTFEVNMLAPKASTQLNQEVTVSGNAVSLAGVALDHVQVSYKVIRVTTFPYWRSWWSLPYNESAFIIKQGSATTDSEGNFDIRFEALPDLKTNKSSKPLFIFKVEGDVTDVQGETRSFSTFVRASYSEFELVAEFPSALDRADKPDFTIQALGASGQKLAVKGSFEIIKLKEPSTVKVNKYWYGVIQNPLKSSDYNKWFPYFTPEPINDYASWASEKTVLKSSFEFNQKIDLKDVLQAGVYKIIAKAQDQSGIAIESIDYTVVTDFAKEAFPKTDFLFVKKSDKNYQPGEDFVFELGTPDKQMYVHIVFEKNNKALATYNLTVNRHSKISIPIIEDYRGGLNYQLFYVKENRWFSRSGHIDVPWSNKELNVTFETFRDKTLPGSKEQYNIKISGLHKEKVMAEVLATMYDASLDQFENQYWKTNFYPTSYIRGSLDNAGFGYNRGSYGLDDVFRPKERIDYIEVVYPQLLRLLDRGLYTLSSRSMGAVMKQAGRMDGNAEPMPAPAAEDFSVENDSVADIFAKTEEANQTYQQEQDLQDSDIATVQPRKNLKETVFFYPDIKTDADGNLILSFTMNEALTKWKLMLFAHTADLQVGYDMRYVQTQKELMVLPNAPRFLRDGDLASINAKISNLSEQSLSGKASIQLWDAITMQDITKELVTSDLEIAFDITKGSSQGVHWKINVPDTKYNAITYRVTAISGGYSDAEENTIPVITNRILVTETMPFWISGNTTRTFRFNAFKDNNSVTKKDFRYTFEYTASPIWYAIQALPYIQESSSASTQALIDRMYANVLAASIANAHPKIKAVFDQWKNSDKDALVSNLFKNEELKTALLEETPWVRQALSENEQKRNIAILFDLNRLGNEKATTIRKLRERQLPNGGFPWIEGGTDNLYTTQMILENIGHLIHLGAMDMQDPDWSDIISEALKYMDTGLNIRYEKLKADLKKYGGNLHDDHLDYMSIHYLYVKSFFSHVKSLPIAEEAIQYYQGQSQKYWTKRNLYAQAMIGLVMVRKGDNTVDKILKSLRERSFQNDELGMYWNEGNGYYWYQLPIERQALLIELFSASNANKGELDRMKMWLLKNKQTNHWSTSKGTASAIYALLIHGEKGGISNWVTEGTEPVIFVGNELLNTSTHATESGTGYIKKAWIGSDIQKEQATLKVTNNNKSVAWGAAYYQYFEDLDNIKTFEDTPLKLKKKIYKVEKTAKGDQLVEVTASSVLNPGDKLHVRIELVVDREMEYVHMKDMRASGLEPVKVLSSYKYQGGLGYYEATKDLATHFYFSYLPKGTFVFEYPLRVVHQGDFSAGITTIECMYAPEFSSHSQGMRIKVNEKK